MRWVKFIEGAFSVQEQNFGKGKQQLNQKNKESMMEETIMEMWSRSFFRANIAKKKKKNTHLEKYCWWRVDAICGYYKQTRHVSKFCKSKAKASRGLQAQLAEAADTHEEQLFAVSYFQPMNPLIIGFSIVVAHITCALMLKCSNSLMILANPK